MAVLKIEFVNKTKETRHTGRMWKKNSSFGKMERIPQTKSSGPYTGPSGESIAKGMAAGAR
jgi:hypothetical protein